MIFARTVASVLAIAAAATALPLSSQPAHAHNHLRSMTLGLNWVAQAEFGGFYQAKAEGRYEECGIDLTLKPGGMGINNRLLLAAGQIEAYLGGNLVPTLRATAEGLPTVVVAALFQRDPQVLMTHPGVGLDDWESLKSAPISISASGLAFFFPWLERAEGFSSDNLVPFVFSLAPFIEDPAMVRQGYVTSEPFAVERAGGFAPNVFLLADHGFDGYSTTIEVNRALIDEEPELVDCLVNASIEGWYSYLYGDPQAAHFLIQSDNPDISIELLEHARAAMIEHGIVDSGLTETAGIGAIDPERFTAFYAAMHEAGIIEEEIDPSTAFDARFVNQGHGLELRDRLRAEAEAN